MSNTPKNDIKNKISEVEKKRDSILQFTNEVDGKYVPADIQYKRENTKVVDKKIVNNKPSQFGPRLGINFHMIKK